MRTKSQGANHQVRALSARRWRRFVRAAAVAAVCAALFTACGGNDDEGPGATGVSAASGAARAANGTAEARTNQPDVPPRATLPPPVLATTTLGVDADANTPAPDASATYGAGTEFDVAITLGEFAEAIAGYQVDLAWDAGVLAFVSIDNTARDQFPACSRTLSTEGSVSTACLRTDDDVEYTGQLARVRLRCTAPGETAVRIRLPGPEVIGTRIESSPARNIVHELTAGEATITCT